MTTMILARAIGKRETPSTEMGRRLQVAERARERASLCVCVYACVHTHVLAMVEG